MVIDMGAVAIKPAAAPLKSLRNEKPELDLVIIPRLYNEIYRLATCLSMREAPIPSQGSAYKLVI